MSASPPRTLHPSEHDRADGTHIELEFGHDAEVATAATQPPEQVGEREPAYPCVGHAPAGDREPVLLTRQKLTAAATSSVEAHRTINVGWRSTMQFHTRRASSYAESSGVITSPPIVDRSRSI